MISNNEQRAKIKRNKHTRGVLAEFAYAITCHLSQGSQFHRVIYIEESMHPSIQSCLNLVGCTRADQQLIFVKNNYKPWVDYNDPIRGIKKTQYKINQRIDKRNKNLC